MAGTDHRLSAVAKRRVLVIDDDIELQSFLIMVLEGQGYLVFSALGADTGLDLLDILEPDAVLLDALLPGCDVLQLSQAITMPRRAPAVVILADVEPNDADWDLARICGVSDILVKPFEVDDLLARVARLVGGRADEPLN